MEVAPCAQEAGGHAASLLASLNLQREQAQFCDCVVIQRQNPGQIYPAHRCVLAASSPVLESILSSTGALVELQAPCLSDSVLALVLEYIYTGALPFSRTQQQYYNLLTAAHYLRMDELQEALRVWQQTEVNAADNTNASTGAENRSCKDINNTGSKTVNTFSQYLPLAHTCTVHSREREDHQYSANVDMCEKIDISKNGANHYSRKYASPFSNVTTCRSIPESSESSVNTGNCRQGTYLTPQDLTQNIPCTAGVSTVDKELQKDQFHSAGIVKPETWQKSTEEERVRTAEDSRSLYLLSTGEVQGEKTSRAEDTQRLCLTVKGKAEEKQTNKKEEDKIFHSPLLHPLTSHLKDNVSPSRCSSSSSSSSPHPCCGAVPVIRHSSRAAIAEVSTMPPYHPVSQASVGASRAPDSQSGSTDTDSIVESITTKHKNHYWAQNQDYRNNKDKIGTQRCDYKDSSDQCTMQDLCYKSSADECDIEQDYTSSITDHFIKQSDENMANGLSDDDDHHAHCDSFQNKNHTKPFRDDSVKQNNDLSCFSRGLKYKNDLSFDDLPSKHQRLDLSDCLNISMATAAEEQSINSQDPRALVQLPVRDSDIESDSCCEDLCPEEEAKEEHSYSSKCPAEMDRQNSHCNLYGPTTDWNQNLHRAKMSTKNEHDSYYEDSAMTDKRCSVDVRICLPVSTTPESSSDNVSDGLPAFEHRTYLELEKISGAEITEPHLTFTMPEDNVSDSTYSVVGQSYHGHLHYHCMPQEDTLLSPRDSHLSHPDHSDQPSDDDEEVVTSASPDHNLLRQHFATRDQVLLLDISAKPAELLVSYKHRSDQRDKWVALDHSHASENGFGNDDRQQWNEATSVAGVGKRKIRAGTKCGSESCDEAETKSWVGETNVDERESVGKVQRRPGAEVIHKAGVVQVEKQTTTLTVCSPPSVPDSVQASISSTVPVGTPSTLSASMPTNLSAHLSTPVQHPFQCSLCDRSFSQRGSLNRHVRSHLGVRPFPCPRCPMTFSRQYRVTEHMRVHLRCDLGSDFQKPPASSI